MAESYKNRVIADAAPNFSIFPDFWLDGSPTIILLPCPSTSHSYSQMF
jgi:hypothetical protein